jgi:hypothetical protein
VNLYRVAEVNLTPTGLDAYNTANQIGTNASAVALSGDNVWVGSWNNSGLAGFSGIYRVSNIFGTQTGAVLGGTSRTTANTRGFSGLVVNGNNLYSAWDNGAASPLGLQKLDATSGTAAWGTSLRGSGGLDIDPLSSGNIGTTQLGSGRRWLYNEATGSVIYNGSSPLGFVILTGGANSNMRSIAFDSVTGDSYSRSLNNIYKAVRTGENSAAPATTIVTGTTSDPNGFIAGINIEFFTIGGSKFLIYNDRPTTGVGQAWNGAVRVVDTNGVAQTVNFLDATGANAVSFADGNGFYSFSFDAANNRIAVADFLNNRVLVFSTQAVPEPATMLALGAGVAALLRRRRKSS